MKIDVHLMNVRHGEGSYAFMIYGQVVRASDRKILMEGNIDRIMDQIRLNHYWHLVPLPCEQSCE